MKHFLLPLAFSAAIATPAVAGAPWLSVELRPAGAIYMVVHTFHHGTANPMALSGWAYGLVDGRRDSVRLRFDAIPEGNNAFGVGKAWGERGVWVLNIQTEQDTHGGAAAVVLIDRDGAATVRFPRRFDGTSRTATAGEIGAMLESLDQQDLPGLRRTGWLRPIALMLAVPVMLGLLAVLALDRVRGARRRREAARPVAA